MNTSFIPGLALWILAAVTPGFTQDPVVSMKNPADGQKIRQDSSVALDADVQYPPAGLFTVHYLANFPNDPDPHEVGNSDQGPTYHASFIPSVPGTYVIHAEVESLGLILAKSSTVSLIVMPPNEAPTVTLDSPANNALLTAPATFSLSATPLDHDLPGNGGGIARVEFWVGTTKLTTLTSSPWTFPINNLGSGSYDYKAVVYDLDSEWAQSAVAHVIVNTPPTVSLAVPTPGPYVAPVALSLEATAADADGSVARVEFYNGATRLTPVDSVAPFRYTFTASQGGTYNFTAKAIDNHGTSTVSNNVQITVDLPANLQPVANAGRDTILIPPVDSVRLDGTGSSDPDNNTPLTFAWSAPVGVTLSNPAIARPVARLASAGAGNYTLTLIVTDNGSPALKDTDDVVVTLAKAPKITSSLTGSAIVGSPFSQPVTATGTPKPSITFTGKPAWLSWDSVQGQLKGTPTVAGSLSIGITAKNAAGTDTKTLSISINEAPKITTNLPDSMPAVFEGGKVTLSIAATGTPPPSYQWQFQAGYSGTGTFVNVGPNSPSYPLDPITQAQGGRYQVLVRNTISPQAVSKICKVTVKVVPKPITMDIPPRSLTVTKGFPATFFVSAKGTPPLSFQWYHDGKAMAGKTDDTLSLANTQYADSGVYRVKISDSNTIDSVPSTYLMSADTVRLTVKQPKLATPHADPTTKSFTDKDKPFSVKLYCDSPCIEVAYTLDKTLPNGTTASVHKIPSGQGVVLDTTTTIIAQARFTGYQASGFMTETYTYIPPDQLPVPTLKPAVPTFKVAVTCTLETDVGADIYYTLDGSDPYQSTLKYRADSALVINATTTVKAIARKTGFHDSPPVTWTYTKEAPQVTADVPTASPSGKTFTGQLDVVLTSNPDATLKYTLDGTDPAVSSSAKTAAPGIVIPLVKTTVIKAFAFGANYLPSAAMMQTYTLQPGPITANIPDTIPFNGSTVVQLACPPSGTAIYYTTNDSLPLDPGGKMQNGAKIFPDAGLTLTGTTTITAMALYNQVVSRVYRFGYTKEGDRLGTPVAATAGNMTTFYDSLLVTLTALSGSTIHCTFNGDIPTESSPTCNTPFYLDSTTTVLAQAYHKNLAPSRILAAPFTLLPDTPSISEKGGSYAAARTLYLSARSKRTPIRYTLDGSDPGPGAGNLYAPGAPLSIRVSATLKAVTVSGNLASAVREESYVIFGTRDTILDPGQSWYLEGGYLLANPEDQAVSVKVKLGGTDSLKLKGFKDVLYSMTLKPDGGGVFPHMSFIVPHNEKRSLYKLERPGVVYFITGEDSVTLSDPGTYFMGTDTAAPVITYRGEKFEGDSTLLQFSITDNVTNLSYDVKRSDDPSRNKTQAFLFVPANLDFRLKADGELKPLLFQLAVHDYQLNSYVPADPQDMLSLSQSLHSIQGPPLWAVGKPGVPWDFVSIPLSLDPEVSFSELGGGADLTALVYDDATDKYLRLSSGDKFHAGKAYFLGSSTLLNAFHHGEAKTAPHGPEAFTVRLKNGWNQVGNPHLERLYWPAPRYEDASGSRKLRDSYMSSQVRGLWSYDPASRTFTESDSLNPWRGYFVYNFAGDTVVKLSARPIRAGLKRAAGTRGAGYLALSLERFGTSGVTLGAEAAAADGLGREDEPELPARGNAYLRALRAGARLIADRVRFSSQGVHEWKVALGGGADGAAGEGTQAPLRVGYAELPPGFEAWIVSEARGLKFKADPGREIPASGLPDDTLRVVAGPREKLAALGYLRDASLKAHPLDAGVYPSPGGFLLRLSLPSRSEVRARLWDLRGRCLADFRPGTLAEGDYRFSSDQFRGFASSPAVGLHFLTVEIKGAVGVSRIAKKVLLRD